MIRTGKYSAFEGPVCSEEKHDAPSISRYFLAREFIFFFFLSTEADGSERLAIKRHGNLSKIITPVLQGAWI